MITEAQKEELFVLARQAMQRCEFAYRSLSGTDVAEAEVWSAERRCYTAVAAGESLQARFKIEDAAWRKYAAEQERKVNAAPKLQHKFGSGGQSVIAHQWVSPDLFASKQSHIRFMVERICGLHRFLVVVDKLDNDPHVLPSGHVPYCSTLAINHAEAEHYARALLPGVSLCVGTYEENSSGE